MQRERKGMVGEEREKRKYRRGGRKSGNEKVKEEKERGKRETRK